MIAAAQKLTCKLRNGASKLAALRKDTSGLALTEFAFTAPLLLSLGMLGVETANYTIVHMKVSQIAMQVADNASRVGEDSVLVNRKLYEDDVNDVFVGADKLGAGIGMLTNGRIILSSLQQNDDGGQWIQWQRCTGAKNYTSSYGVEDDGASGTSFAGMGESGSEITASSGTAVMFVEVAYDYQGLTPFNEITNTEIVYTAAYNVRDARDLTQIYNTSTPDPVANCSTFNATVAT
jgi:hypothetical protein